MQRFMRFPAPRGAMHPSPRLPLALASMLLLAGCLGAEDPQEAPAAASGGGTDAEDATAAGQTVPPATGASDTAQAAPAADAGAPAASTPVTTPFSWDGKLALGACVPMAPDTCLSPVSFADDDMKELGAPGNVTEVALTVTWTPTSPLTEQMGAILLYVKTCGEGCWEGRHAGDVVTGPSPLSLGGAMAPAEADETLAVYVYQPRLTPSPVYAYARAEQAFHVEGTIESLV